MTIDQDVQDHVAHRHLRDRARPSFFRSIESGRYLPLSWVISGALFGFASAYVMHWSGPAAVLAAGMAGALSWLSRGVANLVLWCIAVVVVVAVAFRAALFLSPGTGWDLSWLGPCALAGLTLLLLFGRRVGFQAPSSRHGAVVEFGAAVVAILLALRFGTQVFPAGNHDASLFLLVSEDNGSWINLVANQHNIHGATMLSGSSMGIFGPVVATFLAVVRAATSGVLPRSLPVSSSPDVVLSAYGILIISAPVIAALVVRVLNHLRRAVVTFLVWACVTAVLVSGCMILMSNAFLSAELAMVLVVPAAYLFVVRPRLDGRTSQVLGLASMLLLFGAGAAWIPFIPLAGIAIAASCLPVLGSARDGRRSMATAAVLLAAGLLMELELVQQYRSGAASIGGSGGLFTAKGGTPVVTGATQALILILLLSFVWLSWPEGRPGRSTSENGYLTVLLSLLAYVVAVLLVSAWVTKTAPAYGPTKLEFVLSFVWVSFAVTEFVSRLDVGRRLLRVAVIAVLAVVAASTAQEGPIYEATASHWPVAVPKPAWFDTVEREVDHGRRVLCLPVDEPAPGIAEIATYDCSRFASSVQGKDDSVALNWRFVLLGRLPVSDAIADVTRAKDKPWIIVVTGTKAALDTPNAWWAPIVRLRGLTFVPESG